jgi:hypothetical protein
MHRRIFTVFCVALAGSLAAGCGEAGGPKTSRVYGEVTLGGKPLEDGTIEFSAADGSHAAQGQIKAGAYDIPAHAGPIVDKPYKVSISSLAKTAKSKPNLMPGGVDAMQELQNIIPSRYNSQTTLSVTVTSDKSRFDFPLEPGNSKRE